MGDPPRASHLISGFREAISDANLADITHIGSSFTYTYRDGIDSCVKEKLDRAMSDPLWSNLYPEANCSVLMTPSSDHNPILIDTCFGQVHGGNRRFRFDNSWLAGEELKVIVGTA